MGVYVKSFKYRYIKPWAITEAAVMIFSSSLGSAYVTSWQQLLCVRIMNGVGKSSELQPLLWLREGEGRERESEIK
jgi:hypothetical protein